MAQQVAAKTQQQNTICASRRRCCCCSCYFFFLPPPPPGLMKPALRPSNPARSSFFSRFAFLFSSLAFERADKFSLRLLCMSERTAASAAHRQNRALSLLCAIQHHTSTHPERLMAVLATHTILHTPTQTAARTAKPPQDLAATVLRPKHTPTNKPNTHLSCRARCPSCCAATLSCHFFALRALSAASRLMLRRSSLGSSNTFSPAARDSAARHASAAIASCSCCV